MVMCGGGVCCLRMGNCVVGCCMCGDEVAYRLVGRKKLSRRMARRRFRLLRKICIGVWEFILCVL